MNLVTAVEYALLLIAEEPGLRQPGTGRRSAGSAPGNGSW